jgi:hypothetical protein
VQFGIQLCGKEKPALEINGYIETQSQTISSISADSARVRRLGGPECQEAYRALKSTVSVGNIAFTPDSG